MPDLLRLLAANCAIGIAVGWLLLTLLVATDVNGMGELIWNSSVPALPLGMLAAAFAITFGGAAMGSAVMLLGKDEPPQR
jgi:hypothetical protein